MTWSRLILLWTTLLALALAPASATARAGVIAKTHVGVIDVAAALCIEAACSASLGEYRENRLAEYDGTSDVPHAAGGVTTPYGPAQQAASKAALAARSQVNSGSTLYRIGTTGKSNTTGAQFWALEHPNTPGFAARYGIPAENVANANFIQTATLRPGSNFVTRVAPAVGKNPGGGIEVVVQEGGVRLGTFAMP